MLETSAQVQQEYRIFQRFGTAAYITPVYEMIPGHKEAHIILELCTGGTLQDRVDDQGPLSRTSAILTNLGRVCSGM